MYILFYAKLLFSILHGQQVNSADSVGNPQKPCLPVNDT